MALLVNAYCTARQPPVLDFPHNLNARRDRSDPELGEHLRGLVGFVMKDGREMNQTRYAIMRHAERVQHHLSFEIEQDQFDALTDWGWNANAIFFLPNGAITDPGGNTLVDPSDGSAADGARIPYPADAVNRKQHHDQWLAEQSIPYSLTLPPVVGESELDLRSADEAARRLLALIMVAVRAESISGGDPIAAAEMRERFPAVYASLTPVELAFMESAPAPDAQEVVNHAWRYEAADTLRWALGRTDSLPFPTELCDVPGAARELVQGPETLLAEAALRPTPEILDQVDLHLRLHWAETDARINNREAPRGMHGGVIRERRHAMNWLIRFEHADWDNVTTPT